MYQYFIRIIIGIIIRCRDKNLKAIVIFIMHE